MGAIKVETSFVDDRGEIIDLIENEEINAVTIVTFRKGAVRGNHYHKETLQWNYLTSGKIRLITQIVGQSATETIMRPRDFVLIEPNVRHALVALEDSELMVFTKGPRGGKEYETDTYRLDIPLVEHSGSLGNAL